MRLPVVFTLSLAILCSVALAQAQEQQFPPPTAGVSNSPGASAYDPQRAGTPAPGTMLSRPPTSYRPQENSAGVRVEENDFPRYPYPPYPNPYYEGLTSRNVLNEGLDWFWGVSSHLADRVSNFVDTGIFPKRPATHGGGPQIPNPIPEPPLTPVPSAGSVPTTGSLPPPASGGAPDRQPSGHNAGRSGP
jgi:hypothetical protein